MLTLLSLSFGGNCGSEAEGLGDGEEDTFGASFGGWASGVGAGLSTLAGAGSGAACSDGATWVVTPSPDFDIIATFVPGSTVSPSLTTNWKVRMRKC